MKHHGQILEKAIRESGINKAHIAKLMGHTSKTLWRKFQEEKLEYDYLVKVYTIIGRDISIDFPELDNVLNAKEIQQKHADGKILMRVLKKGFENEQVFSTSHYTQEVDYKEGYERSQKAVDRYKKELQELKDDFIRVVRERDALRRQIDELRQK